MIVSVYRSYVDGVTFDGSNGRWVADIEVPDGSRYINRWDEDCGRYRTVLSVPFRGRRVILSELDIFVMAADGEPGFTVDEWPSMSHMASLGICDKDQIYSN